MHWVEFDGFLMPKRIGGHPALDLCNTWAGWGKPWNPRREWIPDYERVVVWTRYAGLIDVTTAVRSRRRAQRSPDQARDVVKDVHLLRRVLYRSLMDPADDRSFRSVAAFVGRAAAIALFVRGDDGIAHWAIPAAAGLELPLLAAAQSAAELLLSPDRMLVDRCPGDDCGWLFINRSGRRKWCDMSSCGNRAKVRAYNERRRRQVRGK
jgi:predicted RNA-binding Zn ribbon-like protein